MKKVDITLVLVCLCVLKMLVIPVSYADAICLIAVISFRISDKYLNLKKIKEDVTEKMDQHHETVQAQMKALAQEVEKAKTAAEGVKAAFNIGRK